MDQDSGLVAISSHDTPIARICSDMNDGLRVALADRHGLGAGAVVDGGTRVETCRPQGGGTLRRGVASPEPREQPPMTRVGYAAKGGRFRDEPRREFCAPANGKTFDCGY